MNQVRGQLAILVTTKDRPIELSNLLGSISRSTVAPDKIVIVYTGENITSITSLFRKNLNIEVIYSPIASQTLQKSLGIKSLSGKYEWVMLLDDDLVIKPNSLSILLNEYLLNPKYRDFAGFGCGISNQLNRSLNAWKISVLKLFKLYSNTPGSITKSGHAQPYLNNKTQIEVQWLNGASVWSSEALDNYHTDLAPIPYSAYEDVDFSYKVSKKKRLMFAPKVEVENQKIEGDAPLSIRQYVYGGYRRFNFVCAHDELSKSWLLAAQVIRSFDFILRSNSQTKIANRTTVAIRLWFDLLYLTIWNRERALGINRKILNDSY